jgi:hypothetical protein
VDVHAILIRTKTARSKVVAELLGGSVDFFGGFGKDQDVVGDYDEVAEVLQNECAFVGF